MAIRRVRINYTLYSPDYDRATGVCLDFDTLDSAKRRARDLGTGTMIVRNFDVSNKDGSTEWYQAERFWIFDGRSFWRAHPDLNSTKWQLSHLQFYADAQRILQRKI
jgi:hypothetical protein